MWGAIGAAGAALEGVGSIANLIMQYNQQKYYKDLQQDIFAREDTSIQRRVADLKAAGLSPVLAAGQGAGTGGTVSMNAPQFSFNSERLGLALSLMTQKKNIERTDIDIERTKEEINALKVQQAKSLAEIKGINVRTGQNYLDYLIQKELGTTSNNSGNAGLVKDLYGIIKKFKLDEASPGKKINKNDFDKNYQKQKTNWWENQRG